MSDPGRPRRPRGLTGRGSAGTDPVALGRLTEAVTSDLGAAPVDAVGAAAAALREWCERVAVGEVLVRSLVDGELVLEAADARTAADLGYRRDELRDVLAGALPAGSLRRVRVAVRRGG